MEGGGGETLGCYPGSLWHVSRCPKGQYPCLKQDTPRTPRTLETLETHQMQLSFASLTKKKMGQRAFDGGFDKGRLTRLEWMTVKSAVASESRRASRGFKLGWAYLTICNGEMRCKSGTRTV